MGEASGALIVHPHDSYGTNTRDYLKEDGYKAGYVNPVKYLDNPEKVKPKKVVKKLVKKTKKFKPGIMFIQPMDPWKEFVEEVRKKKKYKNTPIIGLFPKEDECLKCFSDKETMEMEKKKYTEVLTEPVPYEKIIELIKKYDP